MGGSYSVGGGPGGGPLSLGGGGSLCTPGRTMRDYDDTFKEMKKENFNLKLRIFFLEERMGLGQGGGREELARENLELKVGKGGGRGHGGWVTLQVVKTAL